MADLPSTSFMIDDIPALLWGESSDRLFVAVHGDMSNKADKVIILLARYALASGYGVLSFDLPEHGDRKGNPSPYPCTVQNCVKDLTTVMRHAQTLTADINLFACSMGAYFSLLTYPDVPMGHCLFLSPVVDMKRLIENMMRWFDISEEQLRTEGEIATPIGKTLYWDYYTYVKAHPIDKWDHQTSVLYGGQDTISEREVINNFCDRFRCDLTVFEAGEHYFHTDDQLSFYKKWLVTHLLS